MIRNAFSTRTQPLSPTLPHSMFTSFQLLQNLQNTWLNEKFAPDLLPQQTDMLDLMLGQIAHMEENIGQLDKNDFRYVAHQMELQRIRYIAASYLRTRLQKIETFTRHILEEDDARAPSVKRLSNDERRFAESYADSISKHFNQIAIQHMPQNLREDNASTRNREIVTPNMSSHIFLKANESVIGVVVGANEEEVDLDPGSLHIMPYNLASKLVLEGKVQLI